MSSTLRVTTDYVKSVFDTTGLNYTSTDATLWMRRKVLQLVGSRAGQIIEKETLALKGSPNTTTGKMYMFIYDPKGKATLPYYDTFPLIFVLNSDRHTILGLNLHYLPPTVRARFLDGLLRFAYDIKLTNDTKLKLTYQLIQSVAGLKAYRPCLKRYLKSHIKSGLLKIQPEEWKMVPFFGTERFKKENKQHVWNQSVQSISKH